MVQGALDGGLDIPHSEKRFVGYSADDKSLDADTLRKHIYGGHVAEYMEEMQEEAPEKYQVFCCHAVFEELTDVNLLSQVLAACYGIHDSTHVTTHIARWFPSDMRDQFADVCAVTLCQVD